MALLSCAGGEGTLAGAAFFNTGFPPGTIMTGLYIGAPGSETFELTGGGLTVRKVIGAARFQLTSQFLGESITMAILALVLALILTVLLLPVFNSITQKNLKLFDNVNSWFLILALTVITGIISGLYPAFY